MEVLKKVVRASKPPPRDLNVEANRLKTFDSWRVSFINKHQLALLGFYYYGPGDMVKCNFCGVEIGMWEDGDDVLTDHMRWSPYCKLIRRNQTNNIPIDEALLKQTLPPAPSPDVYGSGERKNTFGEEFIGEHEVRIHQYHTRSGIEAVLNGNSSSVTSISRPEHPEFVVEAKRIETYEDWPKSIRQKSLELSDAGFYYTGKGDRVCCFSCGGGLKDWEENDDPWEQHGMWYGKCEYLKLMKGSNFIQQMAHKKEEICKRRSKVSLNLPTSSQVLGASIENLEKVEKESRLCKICYNSNYNTIFLPCGHVIACAKCASAVTKCPACRLPFDVATRVYFS